MGGECILPNNFEGEDAKAIIPSNIPERIIFNLQSDLLIRGVKSITEEDKHHVFRYGNYTVRFSSFSNQDSTHAMDIYENTTG